MANLGLGSVEKYMNPRINECFERYNFLKRNQKEDETFEHFLTNLKHLIRSCNYNTINADETVEDKALRDKIVMGIRDPLTREALLRIDNLTLEKAIQHCRTREQSRSQNRQFEHETSSEFEVNKVNSNLGRFGRSDQQKRTENVKATKDPVICEPCFNSLSAHGDFVKNCLKAQEKYKNVDKQPYIKSEGTDIKLEDGHEMQEEYKSLDEQFYIKSEEIDIKMEDDGDQDNDPLSHKITKRLKGNLEIHQLTHQDPSKIQMYKCDTCSYEAKLKKYLKAHQLTHKDPSERKIYRCNVCHYKTNFNCALKRHHLIHKDPSEIQMYGCDVCDYETKHKSDLKYHELTHKDPSEVQMYKCDACDYETKYKHTLKSHHLTHKDPSEIQMYKCNVCDYETKHKSSLKYHLLTHKEPSEIKMYKCDFCSYETKYKKALKYHQLIHKDPSEIVMYKCHICNYETKRKGSLTTHLLIHRNSDKTNKQ